jgi:aryl-alcohol dehydrogenase-like predicted oxidoreductase
VKKAVELALTRMKSDAIELIQFHAWQYSHPSWLESMFWLQELNEEGIIKHLG